MLVQSLGQEDSLEEGMETHSSILGPSQVALVLKNPSAKAGDIKDIGSIPSLIRNCSNPPFGTQGRPQKLETCLQEMGWGRGTQKDFCAQEPHKVLLGFSSAHTRPLPAP